MSIPSVARDVWVAVESKTTPRKDEGGDKMREVPIWEKAALTLEEAAAYSNIGINRLRDITNNEHSELVLWVGNKRLIKRRAFDKFIDTNFSV